MLNDFDPIETWIPMGAVLGGRRPLTYSSRLTDDEMSADLRHENGLTIATAAFAGQRATVASWVAPDGADFDNSTEPAGAGAAESEPGPPVRYVTYMRWTSTGQEDQDVFNLGPASATMDSAACDRACLHAVSDLLCGVDALSAAEAHFSSQLPGYRTVVGRFPTHVEGDRHGLFLLTVWDVGRTIRVVGHCSGYLREADYDATATVMAPDSGPWFRQDIEGQVTALARSLALGRPAPYVLGTDYPGTRLVYEVNARDDDLDVELTGPELLIARRLARCVDRRRAAEADLRWAAAGPVVWTGLSALVEESHAAGDEESELCQELAELNLIEDGFVTLELEDCWIFREGISYDQLIRETTLE